MAASGKKAQRTIIGSAGEDDEATNWGEVSILIAPRRGNLNFHRNSHRHRRGMRLDLDDTSASNLSDNTRSLPVRSSMSVAERTS